MRRSIIPVKTNKQHSKKAGRDGRKAKSKSRRSVPVDRAVLDLVAVVACAVALVICAALNDSAGVASAAGALVALKLRDGSESKLL